MQHCYHCSKKNSLSSQFCNGCGSNLHNPEFQKSVNRYNQLIQDGYMLLNQGRTEEAFLLAQVCLKADEFCKHSWSLLGDCHIQKGNLIEALDCYYKAIERDPDSHLELLKTTFCKNLLHKKLEHKPRFVPIKYNKRFALSLSALVSTVFAIVSLLFFVNNVSKKSLSASSIAASSKDSNLSYFSDPSLAVPAHIESTSTHASTKVQASSSQTSRSLDSSDSVHSQKPLAQDHFGTDAIQNQHTSYSEQHAPISSTELNNLPVHPLPSGLKFVPIENEETTPKAQTSQDSSDYNATKIPSTESNSKKDLAPSESIIEIKPSAE